MQEAVKANEALADLNLKERTNSLDVYNMCGVGGPSFG
jgi:hypothetical protein